MSRKSFAIWFAVFIMLQWTVMPLLIGIVNSPLVLVISLIFSAILFSNIFGIILAGLLCYDNIPDLWRYFYKEDIWIAQHSHGIGTPNFSYDRFWVTDTLLLAFAIVIFIHLLLCLKRCKDAGINGWWILVPLYNPFMLLYKKSKSNVDSEEIVHY